MKVVLLLLSLIFIDPAISRPSSPDCDENCLECVNPKSFPKCRRCKEGYTQVKVYVRRYCQRGCPGTQDKFWDPVIRTYVCDAQTGCYGGSNCVTCLGSGSCVQCKRNYALQTWHNNIAINKCVKDSDCETCVEPKSGSLVCKTSEDSCGNPHRATQAPSTSPQNTQAYVKVPTTTAAAPAAATTVGSLTDPNPEPTSDGKMTDSNGYTDPTVDAMDDDDDYDNDND